MHRPLTKVLVTAVVTWDGVLFAYPSMTTAPDRIGISIFIHPIHLNSRVEGDVSGPSSSGRRRVLVVSTRVRRTLPGDASAPGMARDVLLDLSPQVPPRTAADLRVLLSELVTNALKHAGLREGETIDLDVRMGGTTAEMTVRDPEHVGFEPTLPPDPDGASGWGLFLVDRISDRWCVVESEGQLVAWCEVDLPRHEAA